MSGSRLGSPRARRLLATSALVLVSTLFGAADNVKIGGFSVAVGTGAIDGTVVDTGLAVAPTNSDDAPKIVYDTPTLGGFQLGPSYTPNGNGNGATSPRRRSTASRTGWRWASPGRASSPASACRRVA